MSWTKEDAGKLREYQTACMTVKEIAKKMGKPKEWIRSELDAMGYKPIETKPKPESEFLKKGKTAIHRNGGPYKQYTRITPEIEQEALNLRAQGKSIAQISEILHIGDSSVSRVFKKHNALKKPTPAKINEDFEAAVNEMIEEIKEEKEVKLTDIEKEPVTSANDDTSSEVETLECVSISNDNISAKKSQSLTGVRMLGEMENLLRELFTDHIEITSLSGELDVASIKFRLDGEGYWISFGPQQDTPIYGKEAIK